MAAACAESKDRTQYLESLDRDSSSAFTDEHEHEHHEALHGFSSDVVRSKATRKRLGTPPPEAGNLRLRSMMPRRPSRSFVKSLIRLPCILRCAPWRPQSALNRIKEAALSELYELMSFKTALSVSHTTLIFNMAECISHRVSLGW